MNMRLIDGDLLSRVTSNVVKRADYEQVIAAQDLLASARQSAADQRSQLDRLRQEAMHSGREAGIELGRREWAQQLIDRHLDQSAQLHGLHQVLVDVVMDSLRHLVGQLPECERFPLLAQQVVQSVVRARQLRLVVSSNDMAAARTVLERWQGQHPDVLAVDVMVDDALASGDCLLETDEGAVDGRLEHRLASIEAALRARLSRAASPAASPTSSECA